MSARSPQEVRLPPAFAVRVATVAVGAVVLLVVLGRARTVLHWHVTAAVAAVLLDGPVRGLAERRVPRGLAVLAVTLTTLVGAALLTYGVVDAVVEQYDNLRDAAPAALADLVRSGPLAGLDRRLDLVGRTTELLDQAPERLFGTPASAARTAAERLGEVTLVVTLTVFMLVAYERFEQRLLQMSAAGHPWRWASIDLGVWTGATRARHVIGRAVGLGVVTAVVAALAGVPGAAVLGLWMAWWRLLPGLGLVVGHLPLVLLLATERSDAVAAVALLALVAAEAMARTLDARGRTQTTPHVPMRFLAALGFAAGFEAGGVAGAVVVVVLVHLAVGVLLEAAAPTDALAAPSPVPGEARTVDEVPVPTVMLTPAVSPVVVPPPPRGPGS